MKGAPGLGGEIHHLADLLGEGARERAAEDGEVLREEEDQAAVDLAVAGHDAIARDLLLFHPEVGAAMDDEAVGLGEGARVEQQLDALASGQAPAGMLALDARLAAAHHGASVQLLEPLELLLDRHAVESSLKVSCADPN